MEQTLRLPENGPVQLYTLIWSCNYSHSHETGGSARIKTVAVLLLVTWNPLSIYKKKKKEKMLFVLNMKNHFRQTKWVIVKYLEQTNMIWIITNS